MDMHLRLISREGAMLLYHGSNLTVELPQLIDQTRGLDFGAGFYLTSRKEQAVRFSEIVVSRRKSGVATVSEYEFDDKADGSLTVHRFNKADKKWLQFVDDNRIKEYKDNIETIVTPCSCSACTYFITESRFCQCHIKHLIHAIIPIARKLRTTVFVIIADDLGIDMFLARIFIACVCFKTCEYYVYSQVFKCAQAVKRPPKTCQCQGRLLYLIVCGSCSFNRWSSGLSYATVTGRCCRKKQVLTLSIT